MNTIPTMEVGTIHGGNLHDLANDTWSSVNEIWVVSKCYQVVLTQMHPMTEFLGKMEGKKEDKLWDQIEALILDSSLIGSFATLVTVHNFSEL